MTTREFKIACINRVPEGDRARLYFDYRVQNEVTYTLWQHLTAIAATRPGGAGFIPAPGWYLKVPDLSPYDVVVYFVADRSRSLAVRNGAQEPPMNAAGYTSGSPTGVVSEVYVEMNLPGAKLANIALHEIMHNKLDVGRRVLHDIHTQGGGGIALATSSAEAKLTTRNKQLLGANMFVSVRQYTAAM
ncbi:MAG TPA: hypothetical protein VER12_21040 [Polyangiaceae bacterium]|nr:hypothetical protein [Polyangiaceae bacterium]